MNDAVRPSRMVEVDYDPFAAADLARAVPTTEAQREVWLASQLGTQASLAYNESVSLTLAGPLDRDAMHRALGALAARHEALRATIGADGLALSIAVEPALPVSDVDLSDRSGPEREAALEALRREQVDVPFDLVAGPLFRAVLVRCAPDRHELVLTGHHVICDGWSMGVIATELMRLYRAALPGGPHADLPPAERFGDYALAQVSDAQRAAADADARWWAAQYDASIPVLDLPTDRPRPAVRGFASRREDAILDRELVEAVRRVGARDGASLFVTLLAAFGALLGRLGGHHEVVVGVPAAGQALAGAERLVGHCVQLLPIRVPAEPERPFGELLAETRTRVLDAYDHAACTFGSLLRRLRIERDAGRLPLVSVLFNLDAAVPDATISGDGVQVRLRGNPRSHENFDLFVNASHIDGAIVLECQYNTDLFDATTVRRWLALYRDALRRIAADASLAAADAFAPTDEDRAALARFNATAADHDRTLRVHDLVERQARATPDAVAIVAGDRFLRYRELDARANALAAVLRERGIGRDDLVGLHCGRNEHMIVGLLGILKAGAGYVPMDPSFPPERLEIMLVDSAARAIVCDASAPVRANLGGVQRIELDALGESGAAPLADCGPDDVAYVIYTSGSTGRPKGVRVPHRSVVNLLSSVRIEPGLRADDVVLSVTTLSFDIAVSEVILPLTVGARIVVADRAQAIDGDRLRALVEREGVTFVDATPSTWRLLLAAGWRGGASIRAICTGEPLPPALAQALLPCVGELWNGYGPTETTVWSSFQRVTRVDGPVPIGRPVANTQIHVVDMSLRPVPIGVVGELFIGGEGVTLGYHGRQDLTDDRFLPDPTRRGARWYRTGDLGRWRADGTLECLGRTDHQVKVRGYRIELGEIEAALGRLASVSRSVVVTREDDPGDVRLVAYVVPRDATAPDTLRDALRRTLPDYMIPQHVVSIETIPQLPNGKIDRRALPPPVQGPSRRGERVAPRDDVEARVLAAMESVLRLPGLGVDDDFFALGGHSLLATRLVAALNEAFGVRLPLRTVFESPDAQRLARAVAAALARPGDAPARSAIVRGQDGTDAPLTTMQERIRFVEALRPGRVLYNTPSAHRLTGPLDPVAFEAALRTLIGRQPTLRSHVAQDGDRFVMRTAPSVDPGLVIEDLTGVPQADREAEMMRRLQAIVDVPMDVARAPLFRMALFRMQPEEHVFLFMVHHIVWDGWSFDLLYREMSALYPAALERRPHGLVELPVTYADFARWHADWMTGDECRAQLEQWKRRYSDVGGLRALPTDRPRQSGMSGTGAVEWVRMDRELTERLRTVALAAGGTLNMLVMAVYAAMIGHAVGSRSLVLGMPVRGRASGQLEHVMGFFNNLLPVPLVVEPERTVGEWVGTVKARLLDAMSDQEVPFERIAAEPGIAAAASGAGLYQSLFSFQDARERERRWGPLSHSSVLVMQKGATEDLALWLMEVPGGLEGGINYNADLFDASTAAIFRERIVGLLRRVAASPERSVRALLDEPGTDADAFVGWIDARRAGAGAPSGVVRKDADEAPLAPTALRLRALWATLVGVPEGTISTGDNFFDLGGNSLLAMRAIETMERELGRRVEPRRYLFESLAQIATAYDAAQPPPAKVPGLLGRLFGGMRRGASHGER
ncbi:MAG: amino acid adenylation domain-containing protein [Burkholderiaceae bacterium]|nr:amino acid adenylation domain-containing protein [Burkholderiales bacterium]MCZ8337290.1 amino acid adenylation domain-containing protein [Burkholderiaceae bacterium]